MAVRVIACVVERGGRLLVCLRPSHKRHGGLWEFPGGKIEEGESDYMAARRELSEELGVSVTAVGGIEFSAEDPGSHFVVDFARVEIRGEPMCREHAGLAWVTQEELLHLPLAPTDRRFALHRARRSAGGP